MDCFVVIVVGGFGSLLGALVASLMIGMLQSFGILWIPQLAVVFQFLLMAADSDRKTHRSVRRKGMRRVRICQLAAGLVCAALLAMLPFLLSEARVNLASEVLIYVLFASKFQSSVRIYRHPPFWTCSGLRHRCVLHGINLQSRPEYGSYS